MPEKDVSAFEKKLVKALKRQGLDEIPYEDDESGDITSMTRVEALAKTLWKMSLGYPVYKDVEDKEGVTTRKFHQYVGPDKAIINTLLDRLMGKPKQSAKDADKDKKAKPIPAHERIRRTAVDHINQLVGTAHANNDTRGKDKAGSKGPISRRLKDLAVSRNRVQGS